MMFVLCKGLLQASSDTLSESQKYSNINIDDAVNQQFTETKITTAKHSSIFN